jgi:DNA-binding NarL/FixJ family response regulator
MNNLKTILFYRPNRYSLPGAHEADEYFTTNIPCNFKVAQTWEEFTSQIENNPEAIVFHTDVFDNEELGIFDFIKTVQTLLKFKKIEANLGVAVNKHCSQDIIRQLKQCGIFGIIPSRRSSTLEQATFGYKELAEGRPYWPEEYISSLPRVATNRKPLHIYFSDINRVEAEHILTSLRSELHCRIKFCSSWSDMSTAIAERPVSITFHIGMLQRLGGTVSEFMMMLETLIKYTDPAAKPHIAVSIEKDTELSVIKDLQKNKIIGIVPLTSMDDIKQAMELVTKGQSHWPKHIINSLPGNQVKAKNKNGPSLTGRQQEVFDLIAKRGLSNKQIARVLNISESTVKIHVSAVMKNLCVRNRTQLALTK